MKPDLSEPSWADIIFESRNREYGAYIIRRSYDENLLKALVYALLFAVTVFGTIQFKSLWWRGIEIAPITKHRLLIDPPIVIRDISRKKLISSSKRKVNKNLTPTITKHDIIKPPPVIPVDISPGGDHDAAGIPDLLWTIDPGQSQQVVPAEVEVPKIFNTAEVMPQYEGGLKALSRFISRNIHYPAGARIAGQEGTVYVRFVVSNLGQVVDVEVVKGVTALLDKEAMRVVANMNKWKPGLQHNMPVNVRMILPIKFQLEQ